MVIEYTPTDEDRRFSNLYLRVDLLDDPKRRLRATRSALASALSVLRNLRNVAYHDYRTTGNLAAYGRYLAHTRAIDELLHVAEAVSK